MPALVVAVAAELENSAVGVAAAIEKAASAAEFEPTKPA